jgi:hypothetical protein
LQGRCRHGGGTSPPCTRMAAAASNPKRARGRVRPLTGGMFGVHVRTGYKNTAKDLVVL